MVVVVTSLGFLGCQEPTEAIVEISTDAACADVDGTGINAGLLDGLDKPKFDTTTSLCKSDDKSDDAESDSEIGDIVLVPEDDKTAPFAFKIVTSVGGPLDSCLGDTVGPTCIVARRAMRFVPQTPFTVPVPMRQVCAGVACPIDQTCVDGICKSATVNPESCIYPAVCDLMPGEVPAWQKQFGSSGTQLARAMAVTDAGLLAVAGSFDGDVTFGGPVHKAKGQQDVFLATFTQGGLFRWSATFGGASQDEGLSVAIGPQSDIFLVANFQGEINVGTDPIKSAGGTDVALVKFMSTGKPRWAVRFGGVFGDRGNKVAVGSNDVTYVAGSFSGTMTVGPTVLTSAGQTDAFVASFSASGDVRWAKALGGAGLDHAVAVGVDDEGRVYVAGDFEGEATFGGKTPFVANNSDAFIASLDADGEFRWAKAFGSSGVDRALDLAARGERVVVTGRAGNTTSIDGVPLGTGESDGFVAAFDPAGKLQWSKAFGDSSSEIDQGVSVSIAKDGAIVVGGETYSGPVFGTSPTGLQGASNPFVSLLEPTGQPRWTRLFGSSYYAAMSAVAASPQGSAFVAGWFAGEIEAAEGRLTSADKDDVFLFHVTPP